MVSEAVPSIPGVSASAHRQNQAPVGDAGCVCPRARMNDRAVGRRYGIIVGIEFGAAASVLRCSGSLAPRSTFRRSSAQS
jgi:hypothetical protein